MQVKFKFLFILNDYDFLKKKRITVYDLNQLKPWTTHLRSIPGRLMISWTVPHNWTKPVCFT